MCVPGDSEESIGASELTLMATHLAAQARTSLRLPRRHGVRLRRHLTRSRFFSVCVVLPLVCVRGSLYFRKVGVLDTCNICLLARPASPAPERMATGVTRVSEKSSDGAPLQGRRATTVTHVASVDFSIL